LTLASVESGTGGLMSHRLLSVAGSEECYAGGLILPTRVSQQREFSLPDELFERHGAVSEEVASALAAACRKRFAADFALCLTTDRDGDAADHPAAPAAAIVALASGQGVSTQRVQRLVNPQIHRSRTVKSALNLLRLHLLEGGSMEQVSAIRGR